MGAFSTQIFSNCTVPAKAGTTVKIKVDESVVDGAKSMLTVQGPNEVQVLIDGPRVQLNADDIAGVYPAPGSEESSDEFLPHIALKRRTLPWERFGVDLDNANPWLAVVVFKESELKATTSKNPANPPPKGEPQPASVSQIQAMDPAGFNILSPQLGNSTQLTVLYVRNDIWNSARPAQQDLKFLTHIRRTSNAAASSDAAIVISNRLPDAGPVNSTDKPEMHTACVISLEGRSDLMNRPSNNDVAALVVLHHWKFRPSKGGDFEQVIRSIRLQPNGGVLRFGNVTAKANPAPLSAGFDALLNTDGFFRDPLPHTQAGNVSWRSPLRPFTPPARSDGFAIRPAAEEFANPNPNIPLDYSHATAFELGRLLALSNPGILEDLHAITAVMPEIIPPAAINKMPTALQKPDWVTNPPWFEHPWEFNQTSMLKDEVALLGGPPSDVGGINQLPGQWQADPLADLSLLPAAQTPVVVAIDLNTMNAGSLGQMFGEVENLAHGG
jgi:hypothetical protein